MAVTIEYLLPLLLATVFAASLIASRTKVPHNIILLIIGILLSASILVFTPIRDIFQGTTLNPRLFLAFVIPPLIFEAMMRVNFDEFKRVRISALLLATAGVILATIIGGLMLMYVAALPFGIAFAFSALIAPTDPAIVIAIFKKIRVPSLLTTLMESEASFNDAAGIIVFSIILTIVIGTNVSVISQPLIGSLAGPNLGLDAEYFAFVFLGGGGIGIAVAFAAHKLHSLIDDAAAEVILTIAVVFGAAALADGIGVSGFVAVAVAGLYFGSITSKRETIVSRKTRETSYTFWEIVAFFADSIAFLYLGITLDLREIWQNFLIVVLAFLVTLASRGIVVYTILAATDRFAKEKVPMKWRHTVFIGGMKGAISVALVAFLPSGEFKTVLESITFGVVLISLILQYVLLSHYAKKVFSSEQKSNSAK